ncbi:unnamed protein product [Caenorhabditis bovis]|uniref:DnaJ homolog subfamily C member 21 n=1 Tax=Caenorhabditis bovis TaxID=2654633 RepID=A0A8S1F0Y2_9PELO|nr:unnamed protein product [Caenorhabditis bovis]
MRCHYEILEVERDADAETIKKNYRKLALKWHPDKNPDNIEECTQMFALLQQAYEVLSDPKERDFYDRHRESILKGGFDGEEKEASFDLFKYFSMSCYSGYGDDEKGFYAVYRKVFKILSEEDYDNMDKDDEAYPQFGDSTSDYDEIVGKFYGFWSSFCTCRSFAWLDKYDIRQASNRWEARQIEQENKKYRDVGKQERNEQIRNLVAFVRKRDPRVKAYKAKLEEKQAEAKRKQEENRKKQIIENQKKYMEDKEAEAERIAHLMEVSMQMAEEYDSCSEECDEDGEELPHCVVCNKYFKTINAKKNHENSKQHIKQLNELKRHMREEDVTLFDQTEEESPRNGKKNRRKKKGNAIFDLDYKDDADNVEEAAAEPVQEPEPSENSPKSKEETMEEPFKKEKKKRRADKNKPKEENVEEGEAKPGPKTGKCDRCQQVFPSRTLLFAHLKETGHATLLINKPSEKEAAKKKGKNKNRKHDDW